MRLSNAAVRAISIAGLVAFWAALAALNGDPKVLPGPGEVLPRIWAELMSGELLFHLRATLVRVALAFVLAMSIGIALGLVMGRSTLIDRWLDPWLVVFLNLPALVVIVLCYLWIGLDEVAAVAAVAINKIPTVTVMVREGARALDPALDDMAQVFRMSRWSRLRDVVMPQLAPQIAAASRAGIALIWKIVLVVEFLGRSSGVGFKIHLYFQMFDVPMVLAYALSFVAVMLAIEALILQPIEARARGLENRLSTLEVAIRRKAFGGNVVLRDVAFSVDPGETLAILGPSGIGKSTLLRIVAGLDHAFDGEVRRPERTAMVFQEPTLLPWRSALCNVVLASGVEPSAAAASLAEVGLQGKEAFYPRQLSLGQQRRLALARAVATRPQLLLLDEPFVSLDAPLVAEMLALTERLIARSRPATLFVTHAAAEAERLATRILRLGGPGDGLPSRPPPLGSTRNAGGGG